MKGVILGIVVGFVLGKISYGTLFQKIVQLWKAVPSWTVLVILLASIGLLIHVFSRYEKS